MWKKRKAWTLHQRYRQLISEKDAFLWLSSGDLQAETGSEIIAAQAQTLKTKHATIIVITVNTQKIHTISTIWRDNKHYISVPNNRQKIRYTVCSTTLYHMQRKGVRIRHGTLVWACTKISRINSWFNKWKVKESSLVGNRTSKSVILKRNTSANRHCNFRR
jgi:predicted GTPase